ncbi:MAG: glycosyltransferase [Candidatus Kerfeldbacteria bacterium]|nr:glycosyltransferase [Candidatus Kerfeldbacteria bacterium]
MVRHRTRVIPAERPELTVVLPAHNEEHRIGPTLRDYLAYFNDQRTEFIVVLNGCTDRTAEVVTDVQRRLHRTVSVIDVAEAIGKGGAVRRGLLAARGTMVGFVDADGATTAEEFERLVRSIGNADGVIASRWLPTSRVYNRTSPLRKMTSLGYMAIAKLFFHLPYRDTQCGAKVFKRAVIDAVASKLVTRDMAFDLELLIRARAAGFVVQEVPTIWTDQSSSTVPSAPIKLAVTSLRILKSLIRLARLTRREHLR